MFFLIFIKIILDFYCINFIFIIVENTEALPTNSNKHFA